MTHIVDHSSGCKLRALGVERGDTIEVARGPATHGADHAQQAAELAAKEAGEQADTEAVEQTAELANEQADKQGDKEAVEQTAELADEHAEGGPDCDGHGKARSPGDKTNNLQPHPAAEIFPGMAKAEFEALVADIKQNGQLEPIVIHKNMILDGRHRYNACQQLGQSPITAEWNGHGTPESFVISMNLLRRHLTESQRAVIAAKLTTFGHGGDRSKQAANLPLAISQKKAAEMLNVSERLVRHAVTVVAEGAAELVEAVERNDITVSRGATLVKLPKAHQIEIAAAGRPAKRQAKMAARRIDRNKEAKQRRRQTDDQHQPVQAKADASAGDLEIDRNELINRAEADALIANLREEIGVRDRRIASLLNEASIWRERALGAGWGETT